MIRIDGMLMIGSAGANVGKTELACALLRRFSRNQPITGIKVTTINDKDGQCPRGGEGCGVCASLQGNFCITKETDSRSDKDTSRLSAAGASPVYWLRVLRTHLKDGAAALLDTIGPHAACICESNSLRQAVQPGLFLMTQKKDSCVWKKSAQEVRKHADRIITSDGAAFDLDLERIGLVDGRWTLREKATAIVLAGGSSRRMGTDKSLLSINGRPLVQEVCRQLQGSFEQVLVSANNGDTFAFLGLEIVPDKIPGQGPLMGIASALEASAGELNFVIACDIPLVELTYARRMLSEAAESGADIVVPITSEGQHEPLFAVYRKSSLQAIKKVLSSGGRRIADAFELCAVRHIQLDTKLVNLNTIEEYAQFQRKLGDQP